MSTTRKINLATFLDEAGRIKQIPAPNRTKVPILAYLASKFDYDRKYSEKEVNGIIEKWHTFGDYFLLRRLLIDYEFLERTINGAEYWVVKPELKEGETDGQEKGIKTAI